MPVAATVASMHVCPASTGPVPHVGLVVVVGVPTVILVASPAATVGAMAVCIGPPDKVLAPASPTVLVGGKPPVGIASACAHGGKVVSTLAPTVLYA